MKIVLFDDEDGRLRDWEAKLRAVEVLQSDEIVTRSDVASVVGTLEARRNAARTAGSHSHDSYDVEGLDDAEILVIDFDLGTNELAVTGRRVAYLARCYSTCGFIVLMNEEGQNVFDLTLRPDISSFADLSIGSDQLANPGLWSSDRRDYRPWSWPVIPSFVSKLRDASAYIESKLDEPVFATLGLSTDELDALPRSITEQLWDEGDTSSTSLSDVTFRQLAADGRSLIRRKDEIEEHAIPSVLASRISRWLEDSVLACQEFLVDAPHLVSRFPSLLAGDRNDVKIWNHVAEMPPPTPDYGLNKNEALTDAEFSWLHWLSRPAWRWRNLQRDDKIAEVSDPFSSKSSRFVFCEDRSRFVVEDEARPFVADLPSPFNRRWVGSRLVGCEFGAGVSYKPVHRFTS
jgi:hypothetical protein